MYKLKKDFNIGRIMYIKHEGKIVGFFSGYENPSKELSDFYDCNTACFFLVNINEGKRGEGHFINGLRLLIDDSKSLCQKLVIKKPEELIEWVKTANKLMLEGLITGFSTADDRIVFNLN